MKFISLGLPFLFRQENKKQSRKLSREMSKWNLPDARQNPTCGQIQWPDRSNIQDYHSTISGSIFAHISTLTKTISSLHSWKHCLMFYTSRKTMYKVLSYIHNLVWGLGRFVCFEGMVRWVILGESYCKRDSQHISDLQEANNLCQALLLVLVPGIVSR